MSWVDIARKPAREHRAELVRKINAGAPNTCPQCGDVVLYVICDGEILAYRCPKCAGQMLLQYVTYNFKLETQCPTTDADPIHIIEVE